MKCSRLCALLFVSAAASYADTAPKTDALTVDAEIRLRYEIQEGFNDKKYGDDPTVGAGRDDYLLSRIRLGATYRFTPDLLARVSLQDSRIFGWEFNDDDWYSSEFDMISNPQNDPLELSQTYIQASNLGSLPLTATIGRQKLAYGDKRVFGPGEWKNSGKWVWDAAKLSYKKENHFLDLLYGRTMLHDPEAFSLSHRHGYEGAALYGHYAFRASGAVEPMLILKKNDDGNADYESLEQTYAGIRLYDTDLYGLFYDATYVTQQGTKTTVAGKELNVDACGYHAEAGYTFAGLKLGAGYTYASGEKSATTDKTEKFDAVFGASDMYYGRMNLMSWSNLIDREIFAEMKLPGKIRLKAEYHDFAMAESTDKWRKYANKPGNDETALGEEFDLVAVYTPTPSFQYQAGFGLFKAEDFITTNDIADNDASWLFAQMTYGFKGE